MRQAVRFTEMIEHALEKVGSVPATEAGRLLDELHQDGFNDKQIYLLLALASARWVDHHGPFIGHGTLNMAPMIHAAPLLDERYQQLALLQATIYVLELLQAPNYGPYLQLETAGVQRETVEQTRIDLMNYFQRGNFQYLTENLFVGLYRQSGGDVRWPLLQMGLQEFGRNEHKLLIVWRTFDLLDIDDNWQYGESLLRPAVQYNASLPKHPESWERVQQAMAEHDLENVDLVFDGDVDENQVSQLVQDLVELPYGEEADFLARQLVNGVNVPTLYEAIALTSATLLLRSSDNEEHIVTGIHCLLDIIRDKKVPSNLRLTALLLAMESARTRDFKVDPATWLPLPKVATSAQHLEDRLVNDHVDVPSLTAPTTEQASQARLLDDIVTAIHEDASGNRAATLAANYVSAGYDLDQLAQSLIQVTLTTQGPFIAIHATKMIWRQWAETKRSTHRDRWVHLSSAAFYLARQLPHGLTQVERVLKQW